MFLLTALEEVNERDFPWQGKPTNLIRDLRENSVEVFLLVHSQQGTSEKLMLLVELQSTLNAVQHTTRISLVKCKEQRIIEVMFADCGDFSCCFSAIMKVYEDFFLYKGGIYRHSQQAGSKWKTHSVKLLGWVKHILLPVFSASHECNKMSMTALEPKDLTVTDGTLLVRNLRPMFHFCLVYEFQRVLKRCLDLLIYSYIC